VIGPDEYHERVDDNAFTNVMARWNLRAGADAADRAGTTPAETARWRELARRLVDGYDPASGRYEQFAGYFGLEPLLITDVAAPPVAAYLLLGRDRVAQSQLIKQPDVLMAHHLVPDQVEAGSLGPNLDYYDPRTAHGSSLSPAITASLLARAGRSPGRTRPRARRAGDRDGGGDRPAGRRRGPAGAPGRRPQPAAGGQAGDAGAAPAPHGDRRAGR